MTLLWEEGTRDMRAPAGIKLWRSIRFCVEAK
jgi:hypothetical protein